MARGVDQLQDRPPSANPGSTADEPNADGPGTDDMEQRWHAVVEHCSSAVVVVAKGTYILYANHPAAKLLGARRRAALKGRALSELLVDGSEEGEATPASLVGAVDALTNGAPPMPSRSAMVRTVDRGTVTVEYSAAAMNHRGVSAVQIEIREVTADTAMRDKLAAAEQRIHALFDDSPVGMGVSDRNGRYLQANAALERILGARPGELIGMAPADFVHPADRPLVEAARSRPPGADGQPLGLEVRFRCLDGIERWAWTTLIPAAGIDGEQMVLAVATDITERKTAEIALQESMEDLAAIAAVARCVQSGVDPRPLIVESIQRLSGASSVLLFEHLDDSALVVTASAVPDLVGVLVPMKTVSMTARVWRTGERVFLSDVPADPTVNKTLLKVNPSMSALWQPIIVLGHVQAIIGVGWDHRIPDPGHRATRIVQVIADEAGSSLQASRLHRELKRIATTDPLTGSLNRRAWDDALTRLMGLAELSGEPLAVAVLDVDHFKAYNDRYGHIAGDSRLAEFAPAALLCLRKDDIFARWGGEEFVIALPGCAATEAEVVLERLRAAIPAGLTCSIGHTTWIPGEELDDCIGRADLALYTAKRTGRDRLMSA